MKLKGFKNLTGLAQEIIFLKNYKSLLALSFTKVENSL
jgi:hypothetical protein